MLPGKQPGELALGFGKGGAFPSEGSRAGGTKVAQQRHLVLHSDGCMCLPGEPSAATGKAFVPLPSCGKRLVPLVFPLGAGEPIEREEPCPQPESKQDFGSNRHGVGVKRLRRKGLCTALSFSFSLSLWHCCKAPESPLSALWKPVPHPTAGIRRYQVHQQQFVFFLQEVC